MIAETAATTPAGAAAGNQIRLLRSMRVLAGSQLVTWGLTLAWTVIVPRMIGPRGTGELTTATATTGILLTLMELGLGVLLVREIATDRSRAPSLITSALFVQASLYLPVVAVMAAFIHWSRFSPEQDLILWLGVAGMLPAVLKLPMQSAFQATEKMGYIALSGITTKLAGTVVGIGLVLTGFGVVALAALGTAVECLTLGLNLGWLRRHFRLAHIDLASARRVAVDSLPLFANYMIHSTYTWIDSVLLAVLTSAAVVGWYGVSSRILTTLLFVPVILSTALLPRLSASFHGDLAELLVIARRPIELVLSLSMPITAGAALVVEPVIARLYGSAFDESAPVLAVLLASLPFTYFNILIWQILVACHRQAVWTKVMAGMVVVNVALNLVLIGYTQHRFQNGALGAAAALVVTEVLMSMIGVALLPRLLDAGSAWRLARALLATGVMAAAVWGARSRGLLIQVPVGVAVFALLAMLLRILSRAELSFLVQTTLRRREAPAA
ncbi:MAG: flippase [Candidatus Dormibacteraceae bacterium]